MSLAGERPATTDDDSDDDADDDDDVVLVVPGDFLMTPLYQHVKRLSTALTRGWIRHQQNPECEGDD